MNTLEIKQITTKDIDEAVKKALEEFFADRQINKKTETDEIGGIDLAIEITGLAKPTIYSLCSNRKIPHSKKRKRLYFSRKELHDWIANGKRKTQAEIAIEAANYEQKKSEATTTSNDKSLPKQ